MFFWHDRRDLGSVTTKRCFTDSLGGVSEAPFSGLNLGRHVGDDEQAVLHNRREVASAFGMSRLSWLDQVHGRDVKVVTSQNIDEVTSADAQVCAEPGIALAVMVADCTPVLLSDAEHGVIGAVHAGRPGMMAGVVNAAVEAMRDVGAQQIEAVVGPSVCGRCYEVPADLRTEAGRIAPESRAVTWHGTPAIDVASGVVSQLAAHDVAVSWVPGCTFENEGLYSYRRDGRTGRFAGIIGQVEAV